MLACTQEQADLQMRDYNLIAPIISCERVVTWAMLSHSDVQFSDATLRTVM